jgi:hypothetical protein
VSSGKAHVVRVEYDIEREAATLLHSKYPDAQRIAEMSRQGKFLPPRPDQSITTHPWRRPC